MKRIGLMLAVLFCLTSMALGQEVPFGYSGMVKISADTYLAVSDVKVHPAEPRLFTVQVKVENGKMASPTPRPLTLEGQEALPYPPNDLEAICALPGTNCYLMTESGYYMGTGGRLFEIEVTGDAKTGWHAKLLKTVSHKDLLKDHLDDFGEVSGAKNTDQELREKKVTTEKYREIEGLTSFEIGKTYYLILGQRGGAASGHLAQLVWGEFDPETCNFTWKGQSPLVKESLLGDRDCSDLFLESDPGGWWVWTAAAKDQGNQGPFESVIYKAGYLMFPLERPKLGFFPNNTLQKYPVAGLKVEALADLVEGLPAKTLAYGTDDEDYGGIWRPLF